MLSKQDAFLAKYQPDPERYLVEALDVRADYIWPKMRDVMHSVRDNERTAVKAGHSVSKSYTAARLALWFLVCHPPATVVTTAPTEKQVMDVLWREIAAAHAGSRIPIGGNLSGLKLDLAPKWFATGFSTRPDTVTAQATSFQGYHNRNVLVIFDEAAGILPQIWDAAEGLLTGGHTRFLIIGNPTSAYGHFAACFRPNSGYHQITISVLDTPNYIEGRELIPGLAGREFEASIRRNYGEASNFYRSRVLGEIPEFTEGAIYGKEMLAARQSGRICRIPPDNTALVHTAWDLGVGDCTAIWFVQMVNQECHVIDYYERSGEGLAHYAKLLDDKRLANGWIYGRHFAPHDIEARELGTGDTRLMTARNLGINFDVIPRTGLEDGIEAVRQLLPRSWFDETTCGEGLKALCEYKWRKVERLSQDDKPVYAANPEHDWSSHGADAFRYLSQAVLANMVGPAASAEAARLDHHNWANYYSRTG